MKTMRIPLAAAGGIAEDPTLLIAGDKGREALLPLDDPKVKEMFGGVKSVVNVVVQTDGQTKVQREGAPRAQEFGDRIRAAVQGVIIEEKRPGGLLD